MPILKHRPRLRLYLAPLLRPGDEVTFTVELLAQHRVELRAVTATFLGVETAALGAGQYRVTRRWTICRLSAQLTGHTIVTPGTTRLTARVRLPSELPPTYSGRNAKVEYVVIVKAALPWWIDRRMRFEAVVGLGPEANELRGDPVVFSSAPEGPVAREPHLEGSLASNVIADGGILTGAVALGNVAFNRYTGVRLAVRAQEIVQLSPRQREERELRRYEGQVVVREPTEGGEYPFRLRLPPGLPPSARSTLWRLSWELEVRAKIRWSSDLVLRVPLILVATSGTTKEHRAPPAIGSERVQRIWRQIADEHQLRFDGAILRGEPQGIHVAIAREHRGRAGLYLVATLHYPSLGLELAIEPVSLRHLGTRDATLGDAGWDRRHVVHCREHAQLAPLAALALPSLASCRHVRMNDTHAQLATRSAGASRRALSRFTRDVLGLAGALAAIPAHIPPPRELAAGLVHWRALAAELGGQLHTAMMRIDGELGGCRWVIRTDWTTDGKPLRTCIEVTASAAIPPAEQLEARGLALAALLEQAEFSATARPLIARVCAGAEGLFIDRDRLIVELPAPLLDPRPLAGRLRTLSELGRALSSRDGPYR